MVTNGGNPEGLFRAAIMQGGGPTPVGDITHGQPYYDALVAETGCSGANDTLQCLREVPYDVLLYGVSQSPVPLSYQVRFRAPIGCRILADAYCVIRMLSKVVEPTMDASCGWSLLD